MPLSVKYLYSYLPNAIIVNRGYSGVLFALAIFVHNKTLVIPKKETQTIKTYETVTAIYVDYVHHLLVASQQALLTVCKRES